MGCGEFKKPCVKRWPVGICWNAQAIHAWDAQGLGATEDNVHRLAQHSTHRTHEESRHNTAPEDGGTTTRQSAANVRKERGREGDTLPPAYHYRRIRPRRRCSKC